MLSILLGPPSTRALAPESLSAPSPYLRRSRRRQKSPAPSWTPLARITPRRTTCDPPPRAAVPRGYLPEGPTSPRRLAGLQLRASRLQSHFSFPEARPARLGGHARQPADLRLREEGERGRPGHRHARFLHTHPQILYWPFGATLTPKSPAPHSPRRHHRLRTPRSQNCPAARARQWST